MEKKHCKRCDETKPHQEFYKKMDYRVIVNIFL